MSLAGIINTHVLVGYAISEYGTEEQKQKYLPRLVPPEIRCALSITEPDAGSDAQAIKTQASRDGDDYIINGQKMWVTNGHQRRRLPRDDQDRPDGAAAPSWHYGLRSMPGRPGFTTGKRLEKLGYKGVETTEPGVRRRARSATQVLGGEEGSGLPTHYVRPRSWRINVSARGVGIAQAAFDDAIRYAQKR